MKNTLFTVTHSALFQKTVHALYCFVFYVSFLVFPFIVLMIWLWITQWYVIAMIGMALALIFSYCRFIEPYWLVVKHETLLSQKPLGLKVAIVSDLHLSLHKRQKFLARVVQIINKENPDIVLIPGDFTYYLSPNELKAMFAGFSTIKAPVYAVTGNHDAKVPGELLSEEVRAALEPSGVITLDNKRVELTVHQQKITIIGLSDLWEGKTDYSLVDQTHNDNFSIILSHNPDTAYELPHHNANLLVSGHTHGGQIRLPFIYKYLIPTVHPFNRGWYKVKGLPVFVTSGAGEVDLPMRLGVRPEVVLMEI